MDLSNLLQLGASAILHNSDQATNGLDSNELVSALGGEGNLNLGAILSEAAIWKSHTPLSQSASPPLP